MYRVYYINFQYFADYLFDTLQDAIKFGKTKGLEFQIYEKRKLVAYATGVSLNVHYLD
jgi:hypothetical protein